MKEQELKERIMYLEEKNYYLEDQYLYYYKQYNDMLVATLKRAEKKLSLKKAKRWSITNLIKLCTG